MTQQPIMMLFRPLRSVLALLVSSAFLLTACKENPAVAPVVTTPVTSTTQASGTVTDQEINNWILSNMQYYYLWNDKLPANPDKTLTPDKFFLSLLYDRTNTANPDRDRFSWIQESAEELKASLSGQSKTTGMEYNLLYRDQSRTGVVASVIYVLPGSPAANAGIKRGDVISRVNGQALTATNYGSLLSGDANSYNFGFATVTNGTLTDTDVTKQVTAIVFQEDPVLLDTTYTIGGKTIGYVVYNQFTPGAYQANGTTNTIYDTKLNTIFGRFKQQGVNELILDLRYNRGGYVSSAVKLASLMGKNVDASKVFYAQQWNSNVTTVFNQQRGAGWNTQNFVTQANNIGGNLNRVFVLTTGSTASASELIINGLRPFMTVTTIGTTTTGKNVGSITITDNTGRIKWGMQPITFKSANAAGFANYAAGFTPSVEVKEPSVGMKAFGDLAEPLLGEAVYQISGTRTARRGVQTAVLSNVASSIDRKAGGGNMFVDLPNTLPRLN